MRLSARLGLMSLLLSLPFQLLLGSQETALAADQITIGDLEVSISRVERAPNFLMEVTEVRATGVFVVVLLKVENRGKEPQEFNTRDVILTDSEGRTFTIDYMATVNFGFPRDLQNPAGAIFQPGLTYDAVAVFDVPEDASDFSISIKGSTQQLSLASFLATDGPTETVQSAE